MIKTKFRISIVVFAILLVGTIWCLPEISKTLDTLERHLLQYVINASAHEYFDGSVRLSHVHIQRDLKIRVENITGNLKAKEGSFAFEIGSLKSLDTILNFLSQKPIRFDFENMRAFNSKRRGIQGQTIVRGGSNWSFELNANIQNLGLEDIVWLNPENLFGSSGDMAGTMTLKADARHDPLLGIKVVVAEPGGKVQARFFDLLLPYLPSIKTKTELQKIAGTMKLLNYRSAEFRADLIEADRMKVFLHILIPDYNLNLNLNMTIHVDSKSTFGELAQLLGLIEVKTS